MRTLMFTLVAMLVMAFVVPALAGDQTGGCKTILESLEDADTVAVVLNSDAVVVAVSPDAGFTWPEHKKYSRTFTGVSPMIIGRYTTAFRRDDGKHGLLCRVVVVS